LILSPNALSANALSANARGALWMLASAGCFTAMAILLKLLNQAHYPESQMVFFRCAAGVVALAPFVLRSGASAFAVKRPWVLARRCFFSTLGFFAGFYAFAHLPLADAQAISFSRVLFITVFAVWLLKEQVGARRWTAVAIGFVGVLIMLRPSGDTPPSIATIAALSSALLFGITIVTVKDLTRDHASLTIVAYTNVFTTLVGLPFAFLAWVQPSWIDLVLFLAMGFAGVSAQSCYVRALSTADASLMGLIDYVRLPLALFFGWLIFHERPDAFMLTGAAIIIASTIYITWREARVKAVTSPDTKSPP
jgi:drug/metabolite transporter (DMT)-like permease